MQIWLTITKTKGQEFGCTLFEALPPVAVMEDTTDSISVNVLETNTTESKDIYKTSHIASIHNKFTTKEITLYKWYKMVTKYFKPY